MRAVRVSGALSLCKLCKGRDVNPVMGCQSANMQSPRSSPSCESTGRAGHVERVLLVFFSGEPGRGRVQGWSCALWARRRSVAAIAAVAIASLPALGLPHCRPPATALAPRTIAYSLQDGSRPSCLRRSSSSTAAGTCSAAWRPSSPRSSCAARRSSACVPRRSTSPALVSLHAVHPVALAGFRAGGNGLPGFEPKQFRAVMASARQPQACGRSRSRQEVFSPRLPKAFAIQADGCFLAGGGSNKRCWGVCSTGLQLPVDVDCRHESQSCTLLPPSARP